MGRDPAGGGARGHVGWHAPVHPGGGGCLRGHVVGVGGGVAHVHVGGVSMQGTKGGEAGGRGLLVEFRGRRRV